MYVSDAMQIGKAGEYLVCADLILKGFVAYPSEQGLPYDVVMDKCGKLSKIQVKTCLKPRRTPQRKTETYNYIFSLLRHGKKNQNIYKENDVDLFALVTLDTRNVGYVKREEFSQCMTFRVDSLRGTYYDEKGIDDYKKVISMYKTIKNQSEIARTLNIHVATVNRMLQKDYEPYITNARYFSDIIRKEDWFDDL